MSTIKIDKGVPLPPPTLLPDERQDDSYPFADMVVGDSFFVAKRPSEVGANRRHAERETGARFTWRIVRENGRMGTRIWRVS